MHSESQRMGQDLYKIEKPSMVEIRYSPFMSRTTLNHVPLSIGSFYPSSVSLLVQLHQ